MYVEVAENGDVLMDWEMVANLTHETQVDYFGFCSCEGGYPDYEDCPVEVVGG